MTPRRPDWPERLIEAIEAARQTPFVYGDHDCFLFVADCVQAMTGEDIAEGLRGGYSSTAEGLALGRCRNLAEKMRKHFRRVPLALAHRGDVALAPVGVRIGGRREPILFIVDGAFLRGAAGMTVPRDAASHTWRVPL